MRSAGLMALLLFLLSACGRASTEVTRIVFDGRLETITGAVTCTEQPDGKLVIFVAPPTVSGKQMVRVVLTHDYRLIVERAGFRYQELGGFVADPGEVIATKIDDTYTISGRMPPNPGEAVEWHQFEIETTCPSARDHTMVG